MKRATVLGLASSIALLGASIATVAQQGAPGVPQQSSKPSSMAFMQVMESMMTHMHMQMTGDADEDFATMMVGHHQGAIDMAKVELTYGKDPELRELAQKVIDAQEREIRFLVDWLVRAQADHHH